MYISHSCNKQHRRKVCCNYLLTVDELSVPSVHDYFCFCCSIHRDGSDYLQVDIKSLHEPDLMLLLSRLSSSRVKEFSWTKINVIVKVSSSIHRNNRYRWKVWLCFYPVHLAEDRGQTHNTTHKTKKSKAATDMEEQIYRKNIINLFVMVLKVKGIMYN